MTVNLPKVKEDFASMVESLSPHPWTMLQFMLWLDLKLAEYKVNGYMLLDQSFGELPEWLASIGSDLRIHDISGSPQHLHGNRSAAGTQSPTIPAQSVSDVDSGDDLKIISVSTPNPGTNTATGAVNRTGQRVINRHSQRNVSQPPEDSAWTNISARNPGKRPGVSDPPYNPVVSDVYSGAKSRRVTSETPSSTFTRSTPAGDTQPSMDDFNQSVFSEIEQETKAGILLETDSQGVIFESDLSFMSNIEPLSTAVSTLPGIRRIHNQQNSSSFAPFNPQETERSSTTSSSINALSPNKSALNISQTMLSQTNRANDGTGGSIPIQLFRNNADDRHRPSGFAESDLNPPGSSGTDMNRDSASDWMPIQIKIENDLTPFSAPQTGHSMSASARYKRKIREELKRDPVAWARLKAAEAERSRIRRKAQARLYARESIKELPLDSYPQDDGHNSNL